MDVRDIPLIIPNYNQLTYLRNLINWWKFYYPENPVVIVDNGSNYEPLLDYYNEIDEIVASVHLYNENDFVNNLNEFLVRSQPEYYAISDPDIMPHPATPPNFLEIFKDVIDAGYHRAGFDLIYSDIPDWNPKRTWIQGDQVELHDQSEKVRIEKPEGIYTGYRAPIDTTFCLYTSKNSGWHAPMNGKDWGNCVRILEAYHLAWYEHKDYLNHERVHYYNSVKKRDITQPSAGRNHFNPINGIHD